MYRYPEPCINAWQICFYFPDGMTHVICKHHTIPCVSFFGITDEGADRQFSDNRVGECIYHQLDCRGRFVTGNREYPVFRLVEPDQPIGDFKTFVVLNYYRCAEFDRGITCCTDKTKMIISFYLGNYRRIKHQTGNKYNK